jgi:DNA-binding IclR family transcriptional regulator
MAKEIVSLSGTGTTAADRVADVLLMFFTNPTSLGVSDVARSLGLSKAVVHRILQSLVSRRLVEVSPGEQRYRPGPAMVEFGLDSSYDYDHSWHQRGSATLVGLSSRTGETATLSARLGAMRAFVDQREGSGIIRLSVALWRPRPLYVGASGKAILAFLEPALRDQIIEHRLASERNSHPKARAELEAELGQIHDSRVSVSRGEVNPNAMGVSAPVLRAGRPIGAVGVCAPVTSHAELSELTSIVRDAGQALSE